METYHKPKSRMKPATGILTVAKKNREEPKTVFLGLAQNLSAVEVMCQTLWFETLHQMVCHEMNLAHKTCLILIQTLSPSSSRVTTLQDKHFNFCLYHYPLEEGIDLIGDPYIQLVWHFWVFTTNTLSKKGVFCFF